MKNIKTPHSDNDRIVIRYENDTVHFYLEQRGSGERTYLFSKERVGSQSSVVRYFGRQGRTIRELHRFRDYRNPLLTKIIERLPQMIAYAMEDKKIVRLYEAEVWEEAVGYGR